MRRVAIYTRVSTHEQTTENQYQELTALAERQGWNIVGLYEDQGISGAKGRDQRPEFDRMWKDATKRKFDLIMCWSVDRLGRSLQQLVTFLDEVHALGLDLYLHQQGLDTTTPSGRAMYQMCGVFAEFERSMIQERVKAGLRRARSKGVTLGRPKTSAVTEKKIRLLRSENKGIRKIAKELGVGVSTVQRVIGENQTARDLEAGR
ncbi:recombinase family protein [Emcibacter sp.]|uniref:recombinase family protein n=1 Tax=Emcibacter sp. TaxID=1979954 RepID=UPI003A8CCA8B